MNRTQHTRDDDHGRRLPHLPPQGGFLPDLTKVTTTYLLNQGGFPAQGVTVLPSHDEKIAEHRCGPAE